MKIGVAAAAAVSLLVITSPVQAEPLASAGAGAVCSFASVANPTAGSGVHTGEVEGGPVVAPIVGGVSAQTLIGTILLRCTIQVGPRSGDASLDPSTHFGPDTATAQSIAGLVVTYLPPTVVTYEAPTVGESIYVCSEAWVNGVPYFWDAELRHWSLAKASTCDLAASVS